MAGDVTGDTVPPSSESVIPKGAPSSESVTPKGAPSSTNRRRSGGSSSSSSGRRRSDDASSRRRRRSINLEGVTLKPQPQPQAETRADDDDDDDKMRADDDDKPTSKSMVDGSVDKRYAAVADASYEDNRMKNYPSLQNTRFDTKLSDERNIVYHDDKDGSTWWGIRGTDFNSPKDLMVDSSIVGEHVLEHRFAELTKLFSIPSGKLSAADVAKDVIGTYRKERFANVEKKFAQIRKKYKTGIIHIGGHSLAGALSQHLLKSLSKKKEQRVRVHVFNALPLHGFDPSKHTASYHETRNVRDLIKTSNPMTNMTPIRRFMECGNL